MNNKRILISLAAVVVFIASVTLYKLLTRNEAAESSDEATEVLGQAVSGDGDRIDCVAGEARASFEMQKDKLKNYKHSYEKADNRLVESFELDGYGEIKISSGGCAHYGTSLEFKSARGAKNIVEAMDEVDRLLKALPLIAGEERTDAQSLRDSLQENRQQLIQNVETVEKSLRTAVTDDLGYETVGFEYATEPGQTSRLFFDIAL